jgi:protein phosphatase 1B
MGSFLEKPVTAKESEAGESEAGLAGGKLVYAMSAMQGWRVSMEDTHIHQFGLSGPGGGDPPHLRELSIFGVFDGHGGQRVAQYVADNLCAELRSQDALRVGASPGGHSGAAAVGRALRAAFLALDARMASLPVFASQEDHSGSTAVTTVITPSHFVVANCGDSRLLIAGGPGAQVRFASVDHKPTSPSEQARIEAAGGTVVFRRVNGDLAVSRALGDFLYKANKQLPDVEQQVSAEPEITCVERKPDDMFVLVACDGIWDVLSNEQASEFVLAKMQLGFPLTAVCEALIDHCLELGSKDNMSVVLVALPGAPATVGQMTMADVAALKNTPRSASSAGQTPRRDMMAMD